MKRLSTTTTVGKQRVATPARRLVACLAFVLAAAGMGAAQAQSRDRGDSRYERPPAEQGEQRNGDRRRAEGDERRRPDAGNDRPRGRMTPEERRRLRQDIDQAGREIYR